MPDGTSFPDDPNIGEQFILLGEDDVAVDPIRSFYQAQATLRQLSIGGATGYPSDLRAFSPSYSGPAAAQLRGKTFVVFHGARAKTANRVWLYQTGEHSRSYVVIQGANQVSGEPTFYEVQGLSYAAAIGAFHVNIGYTDNTKQFPDETFSLGHYIYVGGTQGWIFAPGTGGGLGDTGTTGTGHPARDHHLHHEPERAVDRHGLRGHDCGSRGRWSASALPLTSTQTRGG